MSFWSPSHPSFYTQRSCKLLSATDCLSSSFRNDPESKPIFNRTLPGPGPPNNATIIVETLSLCIDCSTSVRESVKNEFAISLDGASMFAFSESVWPVTLTRHTMATNITSESFGVRFVRILLSSVEVDVFQQSLSSSEKASANSLEVTAVPLAQLIRLL